MQAVIMAAGKSTRAYPLTLTKPKPLLKVANKAILEHNLDNLIGIADEAIIIVGYKKNLIKRFIGNKYKNIKIRYAEQKRQLGTAHALSVAEPCINGRFILMAGDDIYSGEDIKNCIRHEYSVLTAKTKNPQNFGVIVKKGSILADLIEKPEKFISNLINTSMYCLDKKIFHCIRKMRKSRRNEFEMPDAIKLLSKKNKIYCVPSRQWIPIGYPWDLLKADRILRKGKNLIGNNSKITGNVKNSAIGDNCTIRGNVENSIIMDSTFIDKNSIVRDSVIGSMVYFQGKTLSKRGTYSIVKNKKIKADKLGAIIADNVKAKNVVVNSGCKIWPNKSVSDKTIKEDIA